MKRPGLGADIQTLKPRTDHDIPDLCWSHTIVVSTLFSTIPITTILELHKDDGTPTQRWHAAILKLASGEGLEVSLSATPAQSDSCIQQSIVLAHITLGRKEDRFYIKIRNPIPQKV